MSPVASPYDEPELYDFLFEPIEFDVPFVLARARAAPGPVLEVACGTGRVLLRLLAAGIDAEGLEPAPGMRARLLEKAREQGLRARVTAGDMRTFALERRFALIVCAFNSFSHMLTLDDQLAALGRMRAHLAPGGVLALHQSQVPADMWTAPVGQRVLEHETPLPGTDHLLRLWDTRTRDRAAHSQHSVVEVEELDAAGQVMRTFRSETRHRWATRNELELLLRHAGFSPIELRGDGGEGPVTAESREMWALGGPGVSA